MQCPKCLSNVPDGSAACPNCGASLSPAASDSFFKRPGGIGADGAILTGGPVSSAPSAPAGPAHCTACGATLDSDSRFCPVCGASVSAATPTPAPADTAPADTGAAERLSGSGVRISMGKGHAAPSGDSSAAPSGWAPSPTPTPAPAPVYEAPAASGPSADSYLRRLCGSPLYLTSTVLYSLLAALCLGLGVYAFFSIPFSYMDGGTVAMACFILLYLVVPPVCVALGLWLLFGNARGSGHTLSTGGLTTLAVTSMVTVAMEVILAVILLLAMSEASSQMPYGLRGDNTQLLSFLVAMVVLFAPVIIYQVKLFTMNYGAARAARYGGTPPVPSDYVSVFGIFSGALIVGYFLLITISFLSLGADLSDLPVGAILLFLALFLKGVCNILVGILCSVARRQWVGQMTR